MNKEIDQLTQEVLGWRKIKLGGDKEAWRNKSNEDVAWDYDWHSSIDAWRPAENFDQAIQLAEEIGEIDLSLRDGKWEARILDSSGVMTKSVVGRGESEVASVALVEACVDWLGGNDD